MQPAAAASLRRPKHLRSASGRRQVGSEGGGGQPFAAPRVRSGLAAALIDGQGLDLGPFVSSRTDWQRGGVIEGGEGYLRVAAVVEPEMAAGFAAYLVVEEIDPVA